MAYDAESDRVILWGGMPEAFEGVARTWAYDVGANTWSDKSPSTSPALSVGGSMYAGVITGGGPMAYDSQSDRIILFLGFPSGQAWAYDFDTNAWTRMEGTETPPEMVGARMVYDAESDRMVLFGGMDPMSKTLFNDTWTYDFDSNTWTKMEPQVSPPARHFHAMAYDDGSDRVILFGGSPSRNDTWAYDDNTDTWEELEPADTPADRLKCDMVYDPLSGRMILFGGESGLEALDDTWAYDYETNTWTELAPETHPSKRALYAAVYSTGAERIILFGGGPSQDEYTDETWIYDPATNTWTNVVATP
jgi:N-acetylneuraminic acid mutarotase